MYMVLSGTRKGHEAGFSLLELSVCLVILSLATLLGVRFLVSSLSYQKLVYTEDNTVWAMRWCQQTAFTHGVDSNFRFSMYTPDFRLYVGPQLVKRFLYPPGVNYKDGYLQLQTGNVRYSSQGTSQVGGIVRLVNGSYERDINLYLGSGLAVRGKSP